MRPGVLQVDGYAGYRVFAERHGVKLAFCWSHVRRVFIDLAAKGASPIAAEVLTRIAALYRVRARSPGTRPRRDAKCGTSAAGRC